MIAVRAATTTAGEGPLWGFSLLMSLVVNAVLFAAIAWTSPRQGEVSPSSVVEERVDTVALVMPQEETAPVPTPEPAVPVPSVDTSNAAEKRIPVAPGAMPVSPQFVETSPTQLGPDSFPTPESAVTAAFIGERNTKAVSDRDPGNSGPTLPSQAGEASRNRALETIEGRLAPPSTEPRAIPTPAAQSAPEPAAVVVEPPATTTPSATLSGPNPYHVPIPKVPEPAPVPDLPKPEPMLETKPPESGSATPETAGGRKIELSGSISLKGESSVEVVETPLGRYQAAVQRIVRNELAVKTERYQQFMDSGFMIVRFTVDAEGKQIGVAEVTENVGCNDVQRSITFQAIRAAKIPKMPPELRKIQGKAPLDLFFNIKF